MTSWLEAVEQAGDRVERLRTDLPFFCQECLRLRSKSGELIPFKLNGAQLELHKQIEAQKAKSGRVRVAVLKARQLGCSTYIAARLYHRTINNPGQRTIIVAHSRPASGNLYQIVKRFHDNMPSDMKPSIGVSNANELIFDRIDSGYSITVASDEGTGRSATAQALHCSEVAFWPSLQVQLASLLQTVPTVGSEIIIETTPFGFNEFYSLYRRAEAGESEFAPIFLPWWLDKEYRAMPGDDFRMDDEEKRLSAIHGLDRGQLAFRREKISQLGSVEPFNQEYASDATSCFLSDTHEAFLDPSLVLSARKEKDLEGYGGLVIGCDPAGAGLSGDRTAIAWRKGRVIQKVETKRGLDLMQIAGWIMNINKQDKPDRIAIDITGLGVGLYDRLREQMRGSRDILVGVNFAGKPVDFKPLDEAGNRAGGAANRRAELYLHLRTALLDRFKLPDEDSIQADLCSFGFKYNSQGLIQLESKIDLKKRGMPSPDCADAIALTFCDGPDGLVRSKQFNRDLKERFQDLYQ
jgi:hypothetical protein